MLKALDVDPKTLDELYGRLVRQEDGANVSLQDLMQELVLLCMEGIVQNGAGGYFLRECSVEER